MDAVVDFLNVLLPMLSLLILAVHVLPVEEYLAKWKRGKDEEKNEPPKRKKRIYKICFTGGPCAGKTTSMSYISQRVSEMNMNVCTVPEAATYLMKAGAFINMVNWGEAEQVHFQMNLMKLQMSLERAFVDLCRILPKSSLVLCDRGVMDGKAYVSDRLWHTMLEETGWNDIWLRDSRYDAVIHMVTAANGAPEHYGFGNIARYESVKQAIDTDNALIRAWTGHQHLSIINNTDVPDFEQKVQKCLAQVLLFIGQEIPFQYFKKFLVKPNGTLQQYYHSTIVDVTETFLMTENKSIVDRVQKRGLLNSYVYLRLIEKRDERHKKMRIQQFQITCTEYLTLCSQCQDKTRRTIHRKRVCFVYHHDQMVLETFFLEQGKAITLLRVETSKTADAIKFPKRLTVIRDVSDDPGFSSHILAKEGWVMDPADLSALNSSDPPQNLQSKKTD